MPARVVAPTNVNFGRFNRRLRACGLIDDDVEPVIFHSRIKIFFDGWLQPVDLINKRTSPFSRLVKRPASSPALSMTGPLVFLMFTFIALAMM
jgi:hypothetical protein